MGHLKAVAIFAMVLISVTSAQLDKTTKATIPTETPTDPTFDPTTLAPTTSPTTAATTTAPTTTASTTTTTTTTTAPTTTSTTTTTTPATTTTQAPSTTPRPVPGPPELAKWWYTDSKTNQTCVIVQLALQLNLTYVKFDDSNSTVLYNVPNVNTTVVDGSCQNNSQWIKVQWGPASMESSIMLQFLLNTTTSEFSLSEMHVTVDATGEFSDAKADQTLNFYHNQDCYATPLDMSYHCGKIQSLNFTETEKESDKDVVATGTISHLQLEAFHKSSNNAFATAKDCEAIDTPDIVPIAVGCALAALVIIVLIAYLIGRRRAQARGYLSM